MARLVSPLAILGVAAGLLLVGCERSKPVWPPDEKPAGWTPAVQEPFFSPVGVSHPSACFAFARMAQPPLVGPYHLDYVLVVLNVTGAERTVDLDLTQSQLNVTSGQAEAGAELLGGRSFGPVTPQNKGAYPVTVPPYGALFIPSTWVPL